MSSFQISLHSLFYQKPINWELVMSTIYNNPNSVKEKADGRLPLHFAISINAPVRIVKLLLDSYPEACKEKTITGFLPLHYATLFNTAVEVVKLLLDLHPEACKEKDIEGLLPLHCAIKNKAFSTEVIKLIVDIYPEACQKESFLGSIPLHYAVKSRLPVEIVKLLIDVYPQGCQKKDRDKNLPLHVAVINKAFAEIVSLLLDACPQACQEKEKKGNLPLHLVSYAGSEDTLLELTKVVKLLVDACPQACQEKNSDGNFPLHVALRSAPKEVVKLLLNAYPQGCQEKDGEGTFPLHSSVIHKYPVDIVKSILDAYPQVKSKTNNEVCDSDHCSFELSAGAKPFFPGTKFNPSPAVDTLIPTVLHCAIDISAPVEVVKLLVDAYPQACQQKAEDRNLPLHSAIYLRNPKEGVVKLLLDVYPQACQEKDNNGNIPLHYCVTRNAPWNIVQLVVDAYPQACQEKDNSGNIPLHVAVMNHASKETIKVLVSSDLPLGSSHGYSWTWILENKIKETALCEYIVTQIFDRYYHDHPEVCHVLAYSKDESGRAAISIVHEDICKVMNKYLLFMGRFEMKQGPPEHISTTCIVIIARDHNNEMKRVALKFMKHRDGYQRELSSRAGIDGMYVVPIDCNYAGDGSSKIDQLFLSSVNRVSLLKDYKYLLVMPASDRSLSSIILHEHICGSDWSKIKQILRDICICLSAVHSQDKIHGDIKPLNIMRQKGGQMCLIDMDAATLFRDICGCKISSCYIPPEMIIKSDKTYEINQSLRASVSYDMWSLGCVLYYLCTCETLLQASISDNLVDDVSFHTLSAWTSETKIRKLSKITDKTARNLVSQLLHIDPNKRPDTSHVLTHPFLTGRVAGRLPGDTQARYDVFLSYRVSTDLGLVEKFYDKLTSFGLTVFWDKLCLTNGKNWEEEFVVGLCDSGIFVPIISRAATKSRFESLAVDSSTVDSLLLEHRLSIELRVRDLISHIYPVYVGDIDLNGKYVNYFRTDASPNVLDIQVKKLEESAINHLDNLGLGSPLLPSITLKGIVENINKNQAGFVEGSDDLDTILSSLANNINDIVNGKRLLLSSSLSTSSGVSNSEDHIKLLNSQLADRDTAIAEKDDLIRELQSRLASNNSNT